MRLNDGRCRQCGSVGTCVCAGATVLPDIDMIERLQAQRDRLEAALRLCIIGGNHLHTHIDPDGPDWRAEPDAGFKHYGAGLAYDAWCCWRAIMRARDAL